MNPDDSVIPLDLDAIRLRHRRAVDGASLALLKASAADVPQLVSEVERVGALVLTSLLTHANLRAAIRAALSAARDGEPEPLAYLADELYGGWPASRDDRGRR